MKDDKILEELTKIRKLLTPSPSPPPKTGLRNEFMDFITKYRVMGLAVAFIMGVYLGNLVQALVSDLIMPIIGLAIPGLDNLATIEISVYNQSFLVGHFVAASITFIIVAFVVFILVKVTKRWGIG